jgi:hypothetical protein
MRVFLTDDRWKSFLKEKKDVGKGNGHKGQPARQKAKGREKCLI